MNQTRPFPLRALWAGQLRGWSQSALQALAGPPDAIEGDLWIYRGAPLAAVQFLGPVKTFEAQLWCEGEHVAHAYLRLDLTNGLILHEVLH